MRTSVAEKEAISHAISAGGAPPHATNGVVSRWSRFEDPVWIFPTIRIYWSNLPERSATVNQADFEALMEPVKQVASFLLVEEGLRPKTIYSEVGALKEFAVWMLSRPTPIKRYRYVTESSLNEYLSHMSEQQPLRRRKNCEPGVKMIGKSSLWVKAKALSRLYHYRGRLEDGLHVTPFNYMTDQVSKKSQSSGLFQSKTSPIPDGDLQALLGAATDFVRGKAAGIITGLRHFIRDEQIIQIGEALKKKLGDPAFNKEVGAASKKVDSALRWSMKSEFSRTGTRLSVVGLAKQAGIPPELCLACLRSDKRLKDLFRARRNQWGVGINWENSELYSGIRLLQMSCFIIIATSTGMRLSEILALKAGCLVKRRVRGYEGLLYWLKSKLLKTSPTPQGEDAFWLCGELAAHAVNILKRLHVLLPTAVMPGHRSHIPSEDGLFRAYTWTGITLEPRTISDGSVYNWLKFFIEAMKLDIGHVHPHQFRRTFARNVVRWSNAPLLALQRHFKHWSLLMTDYYVGVDDELIQIFLSEQRADSRERLRQILAGECGGPGGLISLKRLTRMADNEELPLNFRGREHAGTMATLLNELCDEGVVAYKCADFTTCIYVPGLAKCGEDGPKVHECHPTECPNSHILVEDVPFYLNNIWQNQSIYGQLGELEKAGPFGLFLLKRIRRDLIAIRPLAALYAEKLGQLRDHYDRLSETEKDGFDGHALKNRIERETETLKLLREK